jgi:hypothetical protein
MASDPIIGASEIFNLVAVLIALVLFTRLAVKAKSIGKLRFQLSIFISIWAISEIPHIAEDLGLISLFNYDTIGLSLHAFSMAIFAVFVGIKSYGFTKIHPATSDTGLSGQRLIGKLGGD